LFKYLLIDTASTAEKMYFHPRPELCYLLSHSDGWIYMSPCPAAGKEKIFIVHNLSLLAKFQTKV
jgi:hypothetical protein